MKLPLRLLRDSHTSKDGWTFQVWVLQSAMRLTRLRYHNRRRPMIDHEAGLYIYISSANHAKSNYLYEVLLRKICLFAHTNSAHAWRVSISQHSWHATWFRFSVSLFLSFHTVCKRVLEGVPRLLILLVNSPRPIQNLAFGWGGLPGKVAPTCVYLLWSSCVDRKRCFRSKYCFI